MFLDIKKYHPHKVCKLSLFSLLVITIACFIPIISWAQTPKKQRCATYESQQEFRRLHPNVETDEQFEEWLSKKIEERKQAKPLSTGVITIPVIFHIVHNGEPEGKVANLAKNKIDSQIAQLNRDFANQSGSRYSNISADIGIQFCPATVDTNGNLLPEPGIDRIDINARGWDAPPYSILIFGGLNHVYHDILPESIWNPDKYYNVWILEIDDGKTGVSTFPASSGLDGLSNILTLLHISNETHDQAGSVIDYRTVGSKANKGLYDIDQGLGRTLTHEAGHFLGLRHIWGDDLGACINDDYCDDTPRQADQTSNDFPCLTNQPPQNCSNTGPIMFENYMDYTKDICMNTFTQDQKARMRTVMENSPRRKSLATSNVCCVSADLTIIAPDVSSTSITAGNTVTVYFAENNDGRGQAAPNYVSFHLSPDDVLTPGQNGDTYIGEYYVNQTLSPLAQTILLNQQLTIPSLVAAGTYYIFFSADGTGAVNECVEDNNFATVIITVSDVQVTTQASYRYWFDNQFSEAISVTAPSGNNYNLQRLIPTTSLLQGLHTLNITFKDANNKWSSIVSSYFLKSGVIPPAGSARYEYWFDNDYNNRIIKDISSTSSLFVIDNLNTEDFVAGLHVLNVRFKPDGRHWSSVISSFFYKSNELLPAGSSQYEYWFDNDYGNKTTAALSSTGNLVLLNNLNTDQLNGGLHTFNIRFKPDAKHWSSVISSFFYKFDATPPAGTAEYEYWFDNDYSNRKSTNISSTSNLLLLENISINSLSNGLHTFHIRFKPDGKHWSSAISTFFYKESSLATNTIVSYRYWFDSASSEMKTVTLPAPLKSFQLMSGINANSLGEGSHVIHFQFKDSLQKWSSVVSDTFSKTGSVQSGAINGNTSVCQGSTQIYSVAAIGCATSYTWTLPPGWTGSSTTNTITTKAGTAGGTVTVKANGSCGSNSSQTLNVTVGSHPPAVIAPAGAITFCAGKTVMLKATTGTGYTYQWKKTGTDLSNETSSSYNAFGTGIYSVVVTNATGCSATSAGTNVTMNPVPIATVGAGALAVCKGKTVPLRAVTGAGYTYQWRRGVAILPEASSTFTAVESGNYSVIVTNAGGCKDTSDFFNVVVNPLPLATITPNGPTTFCSKGQVILRANSGIGYTYLWKRGGAILPGETSFTYKATTTGTYQVVVTNASGCSLTSPATTVVVNPLPLATITPPGPLTFCSPGTVVLRANTGTGYTYQWMKAGVNIMENGTSVNYTAKASGVYSVAVTNSFGCTVTSPTVTVTVNSAPAISLVHASPPNICAGQSVLLKTTVGTGYTYKWRRSGILLPEPLSTYQAKETGVYTVEVTNVAGCSAVSNAITVTVTPIPVTTVAAAGATTFCQGQKVQLKATVGAGYTYQWRKDAVNLLNEVNSTYDAITTGVYTVFVKNAQGCTSISQAIPVTVKPSPVTKITPNGPLSFKESGSVTLSVPAVIGQLYQWKKNGTNIPGQTANSLLAKATGSYSVGVTGVNGCLAVSQPVQVSVTPGRPITKAISNEAEFITVYPNPLYRTDYLKIDWGITAAEKGVLVTISDIAGRKINSRLLTAADKKVRIPGASGVYVVEFRWGLNQRKIFRVIKIE